MITTVRRIASRAIYGDENDGVDLNAAELIGRMDAERTATIEAGGSERQDARAPSAALLPPETQRSDSVSLHSTGARTAPSSSSSEVVAGPDAEPILRQFRSWIGVGESLSRQANKKMRRLVGQSWLTNRFGDASVEESFGAYLMHHQLKYVQRAMLALGCMLLIAAVYQASLLKFEHDSRGAGGVLQGGVSMMIVADEHALETHIAAACIVFSANGLLRTRAGAARWPILICAAAIVCYSIYLAATLRACINVIAAETDPTAATWASNAFHAYRFLGFVFMIAMLCVLSCLDYVYAIGSCLLVWFSFLSAEAYLFLRLPRTHPPDSPAATDLRLAAAAAVVDAILAAPVAMLVLLYGTRRINRFERQIFLTTVALQDDGDQKRDLIAGKHTVLLALFSNPTVPPKLRQALRLEPLRFGQEMRFLLRSVPKVYLALVPAATLDEARRYLTEHTPRILMFSGHTLLGALAFEKADGRIDSSNLEERNQHFVAILAKATAPQPIKPASLSPTAIQPSTRPSDPSGSAAVSSQSLPTHLPSQRSPALSGTIPAKIRSTVSVSGAGPPLRPPLECVFLNSCESATLGRAIAHGLSHDVVVICWSSLTEDTAAREFAQGFYDIIGDALKANTGVPRRLPLEDAFRAACDRFRAGGFAFGDPAAYLHAEPNHPHHAHPDFGGCTGCNPPVHGAVLLIVRTEGVVTEYDGDTADAWLIQAKVGRSSAEPSLAKMLSRDTPLPRAVRLASRFRGPRAWKGQMLVLLVMALALIAGALTFAEFAFPPGPVAEQTPGAGGDDGAAGGWVAGPAARDFAAPSGAVNSRGFGEAQLAGDTARHATSFLLG